ncbi:hypothetical protein RJ639_032419 [Escallonia herrerae]|uniref:Cyclic nucleotide-binding domain-containing protein n=1 Tax=Escallonia herrerae TaxID=1293975 RepID=A0AA89BJ06_9ASTE|nr:hypothetical protein RJ639_032419 [Escallonia herrerae]
MNRIFSTPATHLSHFGRPSQPVLPDQLSLQWRNQILDPDGDIVTRWNHIFLITCLISLFIAPLYFYLPFVGGPACMSTDYRAAIVITSLRTLADLFYFLHMLMKFRTAFVAQSSRVFGRGELVMDGRQIAIRYLKSDFIIDLAALLPLPQASQLLDHIMILKEFANIVIWILIPRTRNNRADYANNTLALIVLIQYVPRLFVIFPLNQRIIKTTVVCSMTNVLNVLLVQVAGASWYLMSIGRQHHCWRKECKNESSAIPPCTLNFLDCNSLDQLERNYWLNATHLLSYCDANNDDSQFKFGMFADAFTSKVAESPFIHKSLYCLWWGLRSLSSYGQTLETSTYIGETTFCTLICVGGLILFSQLIGNMQTYLQSMMVRLEGWRVKRRDTEEWMRHRQLPPELQECVRRFVQYKWLATRGVDEESILQSFPLDLSREIQRHQCLDLVRRVPFFSQMNDQLLDAICERLVSSLSTEGTYIVREGDPTDEMLFIIRGQLESSTTNGGRSGFFNSITLGPGDFCGEELLTWALMPNSTLNLPSSTRSVRALSEVEAFALQAEDLKFVASQFRHLHSKKLQHAFRYYSHQWRTWGACFLQVAWRKYKRRKMAKELALQESLYYRPLLGRGRSHNGKLVDGGGESSSIDDTSKAQHLGATILASKFAAYTRRAANPEVRAVDDSSSLNMPQLFKPDEPDFSADKENL